MQLSLTSFSDYTLLVYSDDLIFIYGLVSYKLPNSFINHFTFVAYSLGFSIHRNMSLVNRDSFISSFVVKCIFLPNCPD